MGRTPHRASNSKGKSRRAPIIHDLNTARQMLPLVQSIVNDIVSLQKSLSALASEQESLERKRRELAWTQRQRRYTIGEELTRLEHSHALALKELKTLGVKLVDALVGQIDFPTRINGQAAHYSWILGEPSIGFWRYEGEDIRRPIPVDWKPGTVLRVRAEP